MPTLLLNFKDYGYDGGDRLDLAYIGGSVEEVREAADRCLDGSVDEQRIVQVLEGYPIDLDNLEAVAKRPVRWESFNGAPGGRSVGGEWSDQHRHAWEIVPVEQSEPMHKAGILRCSCGRHGVREKGGEVKIIGIPTILQGPVETTAQRDGDHVIVKFTTPVRVEWKP